MNTAKQHPKLLTLQEVADILRINRSSVSRLLKNASYPIFLLVEGSSLRTLTSSCSLTIEK